MTASATPDLSALVEHIREQVTHVEQRIADGKELGATIWRLALEDVARENRAALAALSTPAPVALTKRKIDGGPIDALFAGADIAETLSPAPLAQEGELPDDWYGDWYERWQDATEDADADLMATLESLKGRVERTILAALQSQSTPGADRVATLFAAIAHGDDEHRDWLETAIADHFAGRPVERPRGKGTALASPPPVDAGGVGEPLPDDARANPNAVVFEDEVFYSLQALFGGHVYLWQQDGRGGWNQITLKPATIEAFARHALNAAPASEAGVGEVERMKEALRQIEASAKVGASLFRERLGTRKAPTWYAVNVLQDHLACSGDTAEAALACGDHPETGK